MNIFKPPFLNDYSSLDDLSAFDPFWRSCRTEELEAYNTISELELELQKRIHFNVKIEIFAEVERYPHAQH